jgi:class 3 adenylate cyclase/tetratricopeptide (TPR) repeat protein
MSEERRVVTVLFSDVAGSTAMGESNDPEDVRALLARYYAIARDVIAAHGGTVEKFIGDSVMAVFGIPQAHGDDAERALVAAQALLGAVMADPQTAAITLRIGVNTGEVVASRSTEAGDFLVTGDAVNVAARLQQHAEPGTILVGERTCRAVSGFRFGPGQRLEVKGKREPIGAATLIERLTARHAPRTVFLGRDHDLAQLALVARRAFSERRPQLVTITAPAGTGKSRLVEEFVARMGAGVRVAVAQCLPYGFAVTFLPLRGLVASLVGEERIEEALPRLQQMFTEAGHSPTDAQRLVGLIGATLGDATESERRDRDEIFTAWRLLIEAQAARGPLVVVFEDLHWATDTLLDLVEQVTVSRMSTPLVMFALARPELLDRKRAWGGGRRNFTSLGLEPLSDSETRALVDAMTRGVPEHIAARIAERSGGNPFFAGELVRAYDERRREGASDAEIVLPDTVHATVLSRIDKLPADERSILEFAAVVGRTARADAIHALLPQIAPERIAQALDELAAEHDLLVPQGGGAYTFRHIVIREVAYATLPRSERVRAHLRLAQWSEESAASASECAEVVAYHYRQAIALSPGARMPEGLAVAKVVEALERAARAAAGASAFAEAGEQLREALRFAPPGEHVRIHELHGDLMLFGTDAMNAYVAAYERWRAQPGGDPRVGARLLVKRLGVDGRWSGSLARVTEPEEFDAIAAEARRLLDLGPDEGTEAKLACARCFARTRQANLDPAEIEELQRGVEKAAAFYAARTDIEGESEALDALASIFRSSLGDWERAQAATQRRLANVDRLSLLERIDAWAVLAWSLVSAGRYDEALATRDRCIASSHAGDPVFALAHITSWTTLAARIRGRWDEALALGDALLAMHEEAQRPIGRFSLPGWFAALHVAAARLDTTRLARLRSAAAAIANVDQLTEPSRSGWTALLERDPDAARRYLAAPIAAPDRKGELLAMLLLESGERVDEATLAALDAAAIGTRVLTLRVRLARALNAGPGELRQAIAALDAGGHVADAARAASLLALQTRDERDRTDAVRRLEALGDRVYLQRLAEEWRPSIA